ncbi:unnamed protein product, partial [Nesidiocoris tenuis]
MGYVILFQTNANTNGTRQRRTTNGTTTERYGRKITLVQTRRRHYVRHHRTL